MICHDTRQQPTLIDLLRRLPSILPTGRGQLVAAAVQHVPAFVQRAAHPAREHAYGVEVVDAHPVREIRLAGAAHEPLRPRRRAKGFPSERERRVDGIGSILRWDPPLTRLRAGLKAFTAVYACAARSNMIGCAGRTTWVCFFFLTTSFKVWSLFLDVPLLRRGYSHVAGQLGHRRPPVDRVAVHRRLRARQSQARKTLIDAGAATIHREKKRR